jgi:hypothetical protein
MERDNITHSYSSPSYLEEASPVFMLGDGTSPSEDLQNEE